MKYPDALYRGRGTVIDICNGVSTGNLAPDTTRTSAKRPATPATRSRTNSAPKISGAAVVASNLLKNSNIAALVNDSNQVYCEISHDSGINAYYFNGVRTMYSIETSYAAFDKVVPIVLLMLERANRGMYGETAAAYEELAREYGIAGSVGIKTLGYFCDCQYYESLDSFKGDYEVEDLDNTVWEQINQAIRTNNMRHMEGTSSVFSHVDTSSLVAATKRVHVVSSDFFPRCMDEEFLIGYNWSAAQQSRIPPLSFLNDSFVPNKEYEKLTNVAFHRMSRVSQRMADGLTGTEAIGNDYFNVILVGKPGSGKTTSIHASAAALGMPQYTVPLSKNSEEDVFEGVTKVAEGGFQFFETSFLDCFTKGGIIIMEEFNLCDPAVMQGAIGQALVPPFLLMKDGYKEVYRHPMCMVVMTMNVGTQGSRMPNEAFTSRAPMVIIMEDPPKEQFLAILEKKGNPMRECNAVYDIYQKVIEYLKDKAYCEDTLLAISMRHCIEALELIRIGFSRMDAINDTLIGALAIKELALAEETKKMVESTPMATAA